MWSLFENAITHALASPKPRSPSSHDRRRQLCVEALEDRLTPTVHLFTGSSQGIFDNPSVTAKSVTTGLGSSHLTWGTGADGSDPSSMTFTPRGSFSAKPGQIFVLGGLDYFNGTIQGDSGIDGIDFHATAMITSPAGVGGVAFRFHFTLIDTPNDDNDPQDEASADSVYLPRQPVSYVFTAKDGSKFTLELVGFGSVHGEGFDTQDKFSVLEGGSASANLLGRFVKLPDLVGKSLNYRVPQDRTRAENGPLPVNLPFEITAIVENRGQGRSGKFDVVFYLSTDAVIDQSDLYIGSVELPGLAPGAAHKIVKEFRLPEDLSHDYHGTVHLGMIVDPDHTTLDEDFDNNQNRGLTLDQQLVPLYDPVPDHDYWRPKAGIGEIYFNTRAKAEQELLENFFGKPAGAGTDVGWTRPLEGPQYSYYTGGTMPPGAFRVYAWIVRKSPAHFFIEVRGVDGAFDPAFLRTAFGEPNPSSQDWGTDIDYVREYQARF
jgi:hypothetical protein